MAYYAAVGYTTSYIASGGEQKAALNGAIAGAAFCFVGHSPLFEGASNYTRIAAHGVIGGLSSTANGGSFESGFLSAGLSQAASSWAAKLKHDFPDKRFEVHLCMDEEDVCITFNQA